MRPAETAFCQETETSIAPHQHPHHILQRSGGTCPDILCIYLVFQLQCDRQKALQRKVRATERIVGTSLPSVEDLSQSQCRNRALSIVRDLSHLLNKFFEPLPSGKLYHCIKSRITRLLNSFLLQAVGILNNWTAEPFYTRHLIYFRFYRPQLSTTIFSVFL